MNLLYTPLT